MTTLPEVSLSLSSQPHLLRLFNPDTHYPIFWSLCNHLDIQSIVRLTRTCKRLSGLYKYLEPRRWNVDDRLSQWFKDPQAFRDQLTHNNAFISGSFALQYFSRVTWADADLDIYVRGYDIYRQFNAMADYLKEKESYEHSEAHSWDAEPEYTGEGILKIGTFYRGGQKLQLIGTRVDPLRFILTDFYATHVVTFITGYKAYSLYPFSTFVQKKGYVQNFLTKAARTSIEKYARRGYHIEKQLCEQEHEHSVNHPIRTHRRITDAFTWTIPFSPTTRPLNAVIALEHNTFGLDSDYNYKSPKYTRNHCHSWSQVLIAWHPFDSHVLKHRYMWFDTDWMEVLGMTCTALTRLELQKLAVEDRPERFEEYVNDTESAYKSKRIEESYMSDGIMDAAWRWKFGKPDYWTYYDDRVSIWFKQWEEGRVANEKKKSNMERTEFVDK